MVQAKQISFYKAHNLPEIEDIITHCKQYEGADTKRSAYQLLTTLMLFIGWCASMAYFTHLSYWISIAMSPVAAGLLTRLFIFQHDCGHGSFWKGKKANGWTGRGLSLLTFTPYSFWRRAHNIHHAASGNLNLRGDGQIDTITLTEYSALPRWKQCLYKIYRNPVFLILFGTPFYTILGQRWPLNGGINFHPEYKSLPTRSIWKSVMLTNLSLAAFYGAIAYVFGFVTLVLIYLPILIITAWIGGWLFYIQHQFEETYWASKEHWNIKDAALAGSSYYALPRILQWFTGNIGIHHIHHLSSKIPNYKLQECLEAMPSLGKVNRLTLRQSMSCINLKVWDDESYRLVPLPKVASG